jgi:hypothetical protein
VCWKVCSTKPLHILETCSFLAGLFKISTWRMQAVLLCAVQRVLDTLDTVCQTNNPNNDVPMTTGDVPMTTGDSAGDVPATPSHLRIGVYEAVIPGVLRCVDDSKHLSVRGLALKLVGGIFNKLKLYKSENVGVGGMDGEVLREVLAHVRDQISTESNHNLKSQGIEIVSLIEKEFISV